MSEKADRAELEATRRTRTAWSLAARHSLATRLEELANAPHQYPLFKLLISKLQALLAGPTTGTPGSGEPEPWRDEGLYYMDAVEIKLLVDGH